MHRRRVVGVLGLIALTAGLTLSASAPTQCTPSPAEPLGPPCSTHDDCWGDAFCNAEGACQSFADCSMGGACMIAENPCCGCHEGGVPRAVNRSFYALWLALNSCVPACNASYHCLHELSYAACVDGTCAFIEPHRAVNCAGEEPVFPDFSGTCTEHADCVAATHRVGCCGPTRVMGVPRSDQAQFELTKYVCSLEMPQEACESFLAERIADDGNTPAEHEKIVVGCREGRCHSFVP